MSSVIVTNWNDYANFKQNEMACKCGCGINRVSKELMDRLQRARTIAGVPFVVNSACRCLQHNRNIGSSDSSDHVTTASQPCIGIDIQAADSVRRFHIMRGLFAAGFDRIAPSFERNFIHAGIGKSQGGKNDSNVMWRY